ncbi:MAG: sigma-54-dependent Fis family transcriptional regulator [Myxococcales bacterium]|nr:sigma-54-dependent Fis family transcriptional regulator [Myxococcales bacterium]
MSGLELCVELHARHPSLPVIVLTGQQSIEVAVAALRAGAYDFVTKPLIVDAVIAAVKRASEWRRQRADLSRLRQEVDAVRPIDGLIGESPAIRRVSELIRRVAQSDATVLITGESGTGKELVARAIHAAGPRVDKPFAALNCGAVPEQLLESELFGHVKGAFTDARRDRAGLFVQAGDGTVFLDEIGEMPLAMQVKLLRVLQERVVRPVGSDVDVPFVARVVCATNRDLETDVVEGRFREDLYYRVNVVQVEVPPLRERAGDVLMLAQHILNKIAGRTGRQIAGFEPEAARKLLAYDWPGNVRELENTIERAVALTQHVEISSADLPSKVCDYKPNHLTIAGDDTSELMTLAELQGRYVQRVLATVGGNKSKAAKILGIDRRSLYRRLEEVPAA